MPMKLSEPITLAQLAAGAVGERFDLDFAACLDNALDPNRPVEHVRKVTLTVTIVPQEADANSVGRPKAAVLGIECKASLAPLKGIAMPVHFGRNKETMQPVALLVDPEQHEIFASDAPDAKILPISRATEEGGK